MKHLDGQFKGSGDLNLYYQCWLRADEPKTILLVVHGLAEHSERYSNLMNYSVPRGYAVCSFNQRGHGKSDGMKGYVDRFSYFVDNLDIFLRLVHSRHHDVKTFLVGHSIGGIIATAYAILHQDEFDGLIQSVAKNLVVIMTGSAWQSPGLLRANAPGNDREGLPNTLFCIPILTSVYVATVNKHQSGNLYRA